jgi:hypothetical protein
VNIPCSSFPALRSLPNALSSLHPQNMIRTQQEGHQPIHSNSLSSPLQCADMLRAGGSSMVVTIRRKRLL